MARNVAESATATKEITRNISGVDQVIGAHPKGTIKAKIEQLLNTH